MRRIKSQRYADPEMQVRKRVNYIIENEGLTEADLTEKLKTILYEIFKMKEK
jgi:hypothetical protein